MKTICHARLHPPALSVVAALAAVGFLLASCGPDLSAPAPTPPITPPATPIPIPEPSPTPRFVPPTPVATRSSFAVGTQIYIRSTLRGDCGDVRDSPSIRSIVLACLPSGTSAEIAKGPIVNDRTWWFIQGKSVAGYIEEGFLTTERPPTLPDRRLLP